MVLEANTVGRLSMPSFSGIILFSMFFALQLYADSPTSGTIDLRQSHNLKVLFDGGLRPFRVQGLENHACMINDANLTVLLPRAAPFQFPVQYTTFGVLAGNELVSLELFGRYTSVPDAVKLTKSICQSLRVSTAGLDQEAAKIASGPIWESQGWGAEIHPSKDINSAQVIIKPLYYSPLNKVQRGGYVNVFIQCGDSKSISMQFLTNPIQPPPGYENVNMDWPNPHHTGAAYPSVTFNEFKARFQAALAKEMLNPLNAASIIKSRILYSFSQSSAKPSRFWLILSGFIALALGALAWFKLRKK